MAQIKYKKLVVTAFSLKLRLIGILASQTLLSVENKQLKKSSEKLLQKSNPFHFLWLNRAGSVHKGSAGVKN